MSVDLVRVRGGLSIQSRVIGPHCWSEFPPDQALWIAENPNLVGDPRLSSVLFRIALVLVGWLAAGGMIDSWFPASLYADTFAAGTKVLTTGDSLGTSDDLFAASPDAVSTAVRLNGQHRELPQIEIQPERITQVAMMQLERRREPFGDQMIASTEDFRNVRGHVNLPPARVGTALSAQIHAQASYLVAYGDAVESMANARKINAEAASMEIQLSIDAVNAYFKRRDLNRANRQYELDPQAKEKRHQERLKRNVDELYQRTLEGDVTKSVNWLLQELASPVLAHQYLPPEQSLANSDLDTKLLPDDLRLIRLTDGGGHIKTLVFAANDGEVLQAQWPFALEAPEFEDLRKQFEKARDVVIQEAKNSGKISYENATVLRESVVALMVGLEAAYPREVCVDCKKSGLKIASKRFLQGLWGSVERATTSKDLSVLSGRLRFQGDGLVALLQHMYGAGLEFAPPNPGGEGVYRKLFFGMRNLYVKVSP